MRILIDLQGAQTESRFRGIGRYSMSLAQSMAKEAGDHEVWVCLNSMMPESIEAVRQGFEGLIPPSRIVTFDSLVPVSWPDPNNAWRRSAAELMREAFIHGLRPDVVHVSSLFEGAQDPAMLSIGKFAHRPRTAVTLYDLIPLLNPEDYLNSDWTRDWYMDRVASLKRSDIMLSISEHAREEAIGALGIEGSRIVNISSAISDIFVPRHIGAAEKDILQSRFGIHDRYVMYSGAMESRKNLERLLEAFSLLPAALRADHHLVIAGNVSDTHQEQLSRAARHLGIADRLVLTGYISDDELITLYSACSLYVFPSLHEGFGLPALEAMACGAPTIGSGTTSVPEVIGRDDALFDPTDSVAISTIIHRALVDDDFNRTLREHAPVQAAKFSWTESARRAIQALEEVHARDKRSGMTAWSTLQVERQSDYRDLIEAVAGIPHEPLSPSDADLVATAEGIARNLVETDLATRPGDLPEHITWRVEGPFDSTYSLALLNRETARALDALGHHVVLHSTDGPGDFDANAGFLAANSDLAEMHDRVAGIPPAQADVTSRLLYPPRVADLCSRLNLLHHYAWEESSLPQEWVLEFNEHLQGMTCLSRHVEKIMIDNGVSVPLSVSGCGVDHWERIVGDSDYRIVAKDFRFLHVSSCFPRKGADVLLRAYGQAFTSCDDVTLVIKTFANPHNEIRAWLEEARAGREDYPDVVIIEDDVSDAELKALYGQCQVLVSPSRAEGYGLPMAEAMLSGLGVITTGWGGQLDFCSPETAWLVDYAFSPAQTHFDLFNSVWAEPDEDHLAQVMREVQALPLDAVRARSDVGRATLLADSTWTHVAGRLVESARRFAKLEAPRDPKIGWITSWNTKCGIATYSAHLIDAMPEADLMIFAARTSAQTEADAANVVRCWDTSDGNSLDELAIAIEVSGVSTLVVQFQYGFFDFDRLATFLLGQRKAGRVVVLMMHATTDAPETPHKLLRNLAAPFAQCDRLFVHSVGDLNRLKGIGLVENVSLFPHGVIDVPIREREDHGGPFVISSYGFLLPHKGLLQLIEATSHLVRQGRNVRLRMINAEYPVPQSKALRQEACAMIAALSLGDRVTLMTDFLPDHESLAALEEADLIVFPYQSTGESASGAVRYGLATGKPVAVTPLPIFDDVRRAVCELPGQTPTEIAEGIAAIMDEGMPPNDAERWRDAHRYSKLAQRLQAVLTQLTYRRSLG
ncbi:glycosyltransferase [Lysobacter sp. H21R4]|uniref:glycosyltransferase n=1 Tax=Lysobacter sp. H21R4 TaxID=2781021 RepID=UPI001887AB04|nr:glycosyltransferase [Lysobacter sp. H21R4]QOY62387.1 glycosyltransferase [Lysobacter sp. H21R4]